MEPSPDPNEERPAPGYWRYAAERTVASIAVIWLGLTLIFVVFYIVPDDPARQFAGKGANAETIAAARQYLELDEPLHVQYRTFMGNALTFDLGFSWYNRESTNEIVKDVLPETAKLVGSALAIAVFIGIPLGLAWKRWPRRAGPVGASLSYLGFSAWSLSVAALLTRVLYVNADIDSDWVYTDLLPALALAGLPLANYIRISRLAAREGRGRANAFALFAKLGVLDVAWLFGATVLIESWFAVPGLGWTTVRAVNNYDIPTVEAILVAVLYVQVGFTLVADLTGAALTKQWPRFYPNR